MNQNGQSSNRRAVLRGLGSLGAILMFQPIRASTMPVAAETAIVKSIPSTGEKLPPVGMGSWITFDVRDDPDARRVRVQVLQTFFDHGGKLVDSSPMYGSSETVIGDCLQHIQNRQGLFAATKVWTVSKWLGKQQMETSRQLWGVERFDLMQIHNMLDWQTHLETLKTWKSEGRVRYIGITTSHGRRHASLEQAMIRERFDFVQFTYNLADREVEQRLLPVAAERGIAVIVNRPFQGGALFSRVRGKPLPAWAVEFDCRNWAQFFLKFAISHPAVTCAIPATSQPGHMAENMGAGFGRLPDASMRKTMIDHFKSL